MVNGQQQTGKGMAIIYGAGDKHELEPEPEPEVDVTIGQNQFAEPDYISNLVWTQVRNLPNTSNNWFNTDDYILGYEDSYGEAYNDNEEWNIKFDHLLTDNSLMRIMTGNGKYGIEFTKQ